jgi:membrane fusion protein (multidrug efflux system)
MANERRRRMLIRIGLPVLLVAAVAGGVAAYLYYARWESTDDAQIDGYIYPVTSRISGYVTRVTVNDNQYVEAGTVLVRLDAKDYEVAVANAQATTANQEANSIAAGLNVPLTSVNTSSQLSTAQADVENAQAGLAAAEQQFQAAGASLRQTEANDLKAQDDVQRYKPLAAQDEIPQQRYTQAVASQKATAAAVDAARASAGAAEQAVTQARARLATAQASFKYAQTRPQQISLQQSRVASARAGAAGLRGP